MSGIHTWTRTHSLFFDNALCADKEKFNMRVTYLLKTTGGVLLARWVASNTWKRMKWISLTRTWGLLNQNKSSRGFVGSINAATFGFSAFLKPSSSWSGSVIVILSTPPLTSIAKLIMICWSFAPTIKTNCNHKPQLRLKPTFAEVWGAWSIPCHTTKHRQFAFKWNVKEAHNCGYECYPEVGVPACNRPPPKKQLKRKKEERNKMLPARTK